MAVSTAGGRCDWHLVGRSQGYCQTYNAQESPPQREIAWPKMPIALQGAGDVCTNVLRSPCSLEPPGTQASGFSKAVLTVTHSFTHFTNNHVFGKKKKKKELSLWRSLVSCGGRPLRVSTCHSCLCPQRYDCCPASPPGPLSSDPSSIACPLPAPMRICQPGERVTECLGKNAES